MNRKFSKKKRVKMSSLIQDNICRTFKMPITTPSFYLTFCIIQFGAKSKFVIQKLANDNLFTKKKMPKYVK